MMGLNPSSHVAIDHDREMVAARGGQTAHPVDVKSSSFLEVERYSGHGKLCAESRHPHMEIDKEQLSLGFEQNTLEKNMPCARKQAEAAICSFC